MFDDEDFEDPFDGSELPDFFFEEGGPLYVPPETEVEMEIVMFFTIKELKRIRELLLRAECELDDLFLTMKIHEAIKTYTD
jgi:hypothetical protein